MLKSLKSAVKNLYGQYELVTCISMFEPWEKKLINSFVVAILGLFIFSSCVYLPSYMQTFLRFISPLPMDSKGRPATTYSPTLQPEISSE